eukprot:16621-Chlamydomonas_euryale.AAC.3
MQNDTDMPCNYHPKPHILRTQAIYPGCTHMGCAPGFHGIPVKSIPVKGSACLSGPCRYEVDIYEGRKWIGGKVASFKDKDGNHIEMGLHVFFGCYFNLFRLMAKCGVLENLLLKVRNVLRPWAAESCMVCGVAAVVVEVAAAGQQ